MINKIVLFLMFVMLITCLLLMIFFLWQLKKQDKEEAKAKEKELQQQKAAAEAEHKVLKENENTVNKMYNGANNGGFDASISLLHNLSEKRNKRNNPEN